MEKTIYKKKKKKKKPRATITVTDKIPMKLKKKIEFQYQLKKEKCLRVKWHAWPFSFVSIERKHTSQRAVDFAIVGHRSRLTNYRRWQQEKVSCETEGRPGTAGTDREIEERRRSNWWRSWNEEERESAEVVGKREEEVEEVEEDTSEREGGEVKGSRPQ